MRTYQYTTSPYTMTKELSAHLYNNYLAFSSTVTTNEISSIFMIFGFGNGTDFTIDISIYLMDTGEYNSDHNLVDKLLENLSIDNNIFGYIPVEKLILVSYPEELFANPIFYMVTIYFFNNLYIKSFIDWLLYFPLPSCIFTPAWRHW